MSGVALARPQRVTAVAVALSAAVGLLVSIAVFAALPAAAPHATAAKPFRVAVPQGWHQASARDLAAMPSRPAAALRSADGKGVVTLRRIPAIHASGTQLVRELGTRLRARFTGFHVVAARFARLRGGRAFVYTFTRAPKGTAQTIAFATAGKATYEIDAVVPGNAPRAARDAAAIIASFGP
jgi:hypothetical protein